MHDGSCIGINCAHRFPKCSGHFTHCWGSRSVLRVVNSILVAVPTYSFLICTRIAFKDSHFENGSFEVLYFRSPSVTVDLSFAARAGGTAPSINAQPETLFWGRVQPAWSVLHPDSTRVTCFCHLNNQNQPGTHSDQTSESPQFQFIQVRRLLHLACETTDIDLYIGSVAGKTLCTHRVRTVPIFLFLVDRDLPINDNEFVSDSNVVTDRLVTPNDFLMSSAFRGSASHVTPTAVHSAILRSTRMVCTQSWYPIGPRILCSRNPQLLQYYKEPSDIYDVTKRNQFVSVYSHGFASPDDG